MIYKKPTQAIIKDTQDTKELIKTRNHCYISEQCTNKNAELIVFCPTHNRTFQTTFTNYRRSKTGLECCGYNQVSQKLTNRIYSSETLKKMSLATKKRFCDKKKGGKLSKQRLGKIRSRNAEWRKKVLAFNEYKCGVTGLKMRNKNGADRKIVCHHLYGQFEYPHLSLFILVGIPLIESIHIEYHKEAVKNANIDTFLNYLDKFRSLQTPISRLANLQGFEGSETRVYDPIRITELQERLKKLKKLFEVVNITFSFLKNTQLLKEDKADRNVSQ